MHDAIEPPLNAHLCFPSEAEAVQSETAPDIGEDGLDRRHPSSVDEFACCCVYLLPHLLREGLDLLVGFSRKVSKLTGYGHVRILHALCPGLTRDAISLGSVVLDGVQSVMHRVATFVHTLPGRTEAEALVWADRKVPWLEDDRSVKSFGDLFVEPLLVSVCIGEPGVAVTEFVVRNIGVDAAF